MANEWPANGDPDWNTKMLANLAVEHTTEGKHGDITANSINSAGNVCAGGFLCALSQVELTISSGAVEATKSFHKIDTEADASTDNLDNITGGSDGDILVLTSVSGTRDIVLRHSNGNLRLTDATNFTLGTSADTIMLVFNGTNWLQIAGSLKA
jgi:hypothetical protein